MRSKRGPKHTKTEPEHLLGLRDLWHASKSWITQVELFVWYFPLLGNAGHRDTIHFFLMGAVLVGAAAERSREQVQFY